MLPCIREKYSKLLSRLLILILCLVITYFAFTASDRSKNASKDRLKLAFDYNLKDIKIDNQHETEVKSKEPVISLSNLNIFDAARYAEVENKDIQVPNTCVQSGLKVIYKYV